MDLKGMFTGHPASVGETYTQHLLTASGFAATMFVGALACLVHAVLPFLCVRTGSTTIIRLHDRMVANRATASARPAARLDRATQ